MLPIHKLLQKSIKGLLVLLVFASQSAFAAHDGESAGTLHEHNHECVLCLFEGQSDTAACATPPVFAADAGGLNYGSTDAALAKLTPSCYSIRAPPQ